MEITKEIVIDKIEILEMGQIQVRQATRIIEDGKVISENFHRHVCEPDHADIEDQDPKVQRIAAVVWTDEVKKSWKDFKKSQEENGK